MGARKHVRLLATALGVWGAFWAAGLPAYYQQYSAAAMGVLCVVVATLGSVGALAALVRCRPSSRMPRALWLAFYFTVPLAALDAGYCGLYLGHGARFLSSYWYLTVFYVTPWIAFPSTAALLGALEPPRPRAG